MPLKVVYLLEYSYWAAYGIKKFTIIKFRILEICKFGTSKSQHLFGKFQGNPFPISSCFRKQTIHNQIRYVNCEMRLVYYRHVTCGNYWQSIFPMVRQQNSENISSRKGYLSKKRY